MHPLGIKTVITAGHIAMLALAMAEVTKTEIICGVRHFSAGIRMLACSPKASTLNTTSLIISIYL